MHPVISLVSAAADNRRTRGFPRPQRVLQLPACQWEQAQSMLQLLQQLARKEVSSSDWQSLAAVTSQCLTRPLQPGLCLSPPCC